MRTALWKSVHSELEIRLRLETRFNFFSFCGSNSFFQFIWFFEFIRFVEFVWLFELIGWKNIFGKMSYLFIER